MNEKYQLYGTMDIYIDERASLYIRDLDTWKYSYLKIDNEDAHKHISVIVLNDISKEWLEN